MRIQKVQITPSEMGLFSVLVWAQDIQGRNVVVLEAGVALPKMKFLLKDITDNENVQQYKAQRKDTLSAKG